MEKYEEAQEALDYFLFYNIFNAPQKRGWRVTFLGDDYAVMDEATKEIYHFYVEIHPGSRLTEDEWQQVYEEQEWFEEDD